MGIRDSRELAWQDWTGQRVFRPRHRRPGRGGLLGLPVGAGLRRLRRRGEALLAARDGGALVPAGGLGRAGRLPGRRARQLGAALPRHLGHRARGAGAVRAAGAGRGGVRPGRVPVPAPGGRAHRHRPGRSTACAARSWSPATAARGTRSSRTEVGQFELHAPAVIVTSGGIGGNFDLIRENWPARLGPPPERMICGVPEHVDGRMLAIAERAGGRLVNRDRMWHYAEGIENWDPDLGAARHQDPAGALIALVRRPRTAVPGAELPGLRQPGHAGRHPGQRL